MVGWLAASIGGALLTAMVVEVAEGPTWRRLVAMAVRGPVPGTGGRDGRRADGPDFRRIGGPIASGS